MRSWWSLSVPLLILPAGGPVQTLLDQLDGSRSPGPWVLLSVLILAAFVSEDLTCISAGLLIRAGQVDLFVGLLGCFLGIFAGDMGLWLLGRLAGLGLGRSRWLAGRLLRRFGELGLWFDNQGWTAILAARFLPGTRVPLYLAAGVLGSKAGRFLLWTGLAALLWTPLLVLGTVLLGEVVIGILTYLLGPGSSPLLLGVLALFFLIRTVGALWTRRGRQRLLARVSRLWRWEFWPAWLFYLPVLPWLAYLALRYRNPLAWTAANPGIPHGGVVGESKYAILEKLPARWVIPGFLLPPATIDTRLEQLRQALTERGWQFPLIFKPDAAQRGAGVKKVRDLHAGEDYLRSQPGPVVVQTYHPGPYEVGIFYYRLPGEEAGHIFSITDKVFPVLVGDGKCSVEELIWDHPRYRMQAETFLARHKTQKTRILAEGERLPLALAGNHCQGTLFRDGAHLITPELERTVDAIARSSGGFFIGRFDVRFSDITAFKAGRDLAIVELNGVTSESTNIYDPSWSLLDAYRTLFRQWSLLYRIGAANRKLGHESTRAPTLVRLVRDYYCQRHIDPLAD